MDSVQAPSSTFYVLDLLPVNVPNWKVEPVSGDTYQISPASARSRIAARSCTCPRPPWVNITTTLSLEIGHHAAF